MSHSDPAPSSSGALRTIVLIRLPVLGIILAVAIALLVRRPTDRADVAVIVTGEEAAAAINTGDVIDATGRAPGLVPRLGYRYKVFIDDESEDRTSGIAKIGGLVTFIPGTRPGQTAIIDITRVRERVADGLLVAVLSEVDLPPKAPRTPYAPRPGDVTAHVVAGAEMDVVITEASSRNPDTEGVARIKGLVVFVKGVTTIGERVNVRIIERRERMAFAEVTGNPPGTGPLPEAEAPHERVPRGSYVPPAGDATAHVVAGAEMDVVITEASSRNPDTEGVARIKGLVVFVKGVTTIGERVNVRITERRERVAMAEPTGQPAGHERLPAPTAAPRPPAVPVTADARDAVPHLVPGAVIATTILEPSTRNPDTEGLAKIDGFVIFVKGATTPGQAVNVRITERRRTVAMGEVTTDPATVAPASAPPATAPETP